MKKYGRKFFFLINKGINDAKIWFKAGRRVISQVDDDIYTQEKKIVATYGIIQVINRHIILHIT